MVREGGKNVNDGKSRGEAEDRTRQCERNFEGKKEEMAAQVTRRDYKK